MENTLNVSGLEQSCRQKASTKAKQIIDDVQKKHPTPEAQFHGLAALFVMKADCVLRSLENFDPQKYAERFKIYTQKDQKDLLDAAHIQLLVLEELKGHMNDPVLLQFNGNAFDFEKCCKRMEEEKTRFNTSMEVYSNMGQLPAEEAAKIEKLLDQLDQREIAPLPDMRKPAEQSIVAKLSCVACQILSIFLVVEDLITA